MSWMTELAAHYENIRQRHPYDKMLILFDIDGTILDMRYLIGYVLQGYDRIHGTAHFQNLTANAITVHENQIAPLLAALNIPVAERSSIMEWFEAEAWSSLAILEAHRPFAGVLEVIRWFQMQPNTDVGLNTGRLNAIRQDTLRSLNQLGREYKVQFTNDLLYMNPNTWAEPVTLAKVSGVRYFQQLGYRVVAFIDNEPDNLQCVADIDPHHDILLLHADTIFQSKRGQLPDRAVAGTEYSLTDLISEQALPRHIHFVWNTINDPGNLAQFLASDVYWGEFYVQVDANAADQNSNWLSRRVLLERVLWRLRNRKKGIKLNLVRLNSPDADGQLVGSILDLLHRYGFSGFNLWFNANPEHLQKRDFRQLAIAFPGAVIQIPIDFLAPLLQSNPAKARETLKMYQTWGVNRFGLSWRTPNLRHLFDTLANWSIEVDIYNVDDLESFLQAVLLMPGSITTTFDFPAWSYYGVEATDRGSYTTQPSELISVP